MLEDAANGERRSCLPEDRMLDQLNRKSDAARYAIKFPYQPKPEEDPRLPPAQREARPTLNLDDPAGLFATPSNRTKQEKLDLSLSLSDIRQVRDSIPLSELRALQPVQRAEPDAEALAPRISKRRVDPYLDAYLVPDYFERPALPQQRQAVKPVYPREQKENLLFVPVARQRDSAESVQIGWRKPQNYYY